MKSTDDLIEIHNELYLSCYYYAAGRLNDERTRDALRGIVNDCIKWYLSGDVYDFEIMCDATNNPPELRARGGYHIDLTITEKGGLKRTFLLPIHSPDSPVMSLTVWPPNHNSAASVGIATPDSDSQDRR